MSSYSVESKTGGREMLTPLEEQAAAGAHEQWCRGQAQAIEDKLRVEWQAQVEELKSAASGPWRGVEAVW